MSLFAAYRASRSYNDQLYAGSPGSAAFAGSEFATAHRLPPQYRFTRRTCVCSDCSVSKADDGSPYSVNASSSIPTSRLLDFVLAYVVVFAVALAAASPAAISATAVTRIMRILTSTPLLACGDRTRQKTFRTSIEVN